MPTEAARSARVTAAFASASVVAVRELAVSVGTGELAAWVGTGELAALVGTGELAAGCGGARRKSLGLGFANPNPNPNAKRNPNQNPDRKRNPNPNPNPNPDAKPKPNPNLRWREEEEPANDVLLDQHGEDGGDRRVHCEQQQAEAEEWLADQPARSAVARAPRRRDHGCASEHHGDVLDDDEGGEGARRRAMGREPLCERRAQQHDGQRERERQQRHRHQRRRRRFRQKERQHKRPRPVSGGAHGDRGASELQHVTPCVLRRAALSCAAWRRLAPPRRRHSASTNTAPNYAGSDTQRT